ncbi:MAG: N-acetyltransferase [Parvularculaceae bacterium]
MDRAASQLALTIREAEEDDRGAIRDIVTRAFGRDDETRLVERLWAEDAAALEVVGLIDDGIVGYCGFSPVAAEPAIKGSALGMAPVAVLPEHQGKGVGAAMIETGFEIAKSRGAALIVVLGEPAYYQRFGFEPASAFNFRWAAMDAGDAFQMIDFGAGDAIARAIHYHPAFAELS